MEKNQIILAVIFLSIILIVIAIFLFSVLVIQRNRANKNFSDKLMMLKEFEEQILKAKLETQEETLSIISKELHDNVGQLLNSTKLLIGITQRSLEMAPTTLNTAEETLGKAIQEIRSLAKSFNKEWLEQFNLLENLNTEIERINSSNLLQIRFTHTNEILLPNNSQIIVFRIIQEVLQNAIKHSKASLITINITYAQEQMLEICVIDNGIGIDTSIIKKGMGISNIEHRVKILNGKVTWQNAFTKGTMVTILIPFKRRIYEN